MTRVVWLSPDAVALARNTSLYTSYSALLSSLSKLHSRSSSVGTSSSEDKATIQLYRFVGVFFNNPSSVIINESLAVHTLIYSNQNGVVFPPPLPSALY